MARWRRLLAAALDGVAAQTLARQVRHGLRTSRLDVRVMTGDASHFPLALDPAAAQLHLLHVPDGREEFPHPVGGHGKDGDHVIPRCSGTEIAILFAGKEDVRVPTEVALGTNVVAQAVRKLREVERLTGQRLPRAARPAAFAERKARPNRGSTRNRWPG